MAQNRMQERIRSSALGTAIMSLVAFYLGDRIGAYIVFGLDMQLGSQVTRGLQALIAKPLYLDLNGLVTPMHEETYIADFLDGVPFDHPEIFAHATAEQMNILAQQLKMADPDDLDKVQDWIDAFDTPKNIVELMNLVEDAESINRVEYEFSTNGLDKEEAYVFHLIDNDPDFQKITERYPGLKIVDYGQIVIDEVTLLDDGFIDPIGSSPDLNKHSLNELKELIGEEYDRQNDKGFFEEEQVGLSDLMLLSISTIPATTPIPMILTHVRLCGQRTRATCAFALPPFVFSRCREPNKSKQDIQMI